MKIIMNLELSYVECFDCKNYFFIHDIDMNGRELNMPRYCPYCRTKFEYELEV